MDDPNKFDIPDISQRAPSPDLAPEKLAFTPPPEAPVNLPAAITWHAQGKPALLFATPSGWSDAPAERVTWLPIERANVNPEAPLLKQTRILVALEHAGSDGHIWTLQLRHFANPVAEVVMQNPTNWARAKASWSQPQGEPIHRSVAGRPAVILRYAYTLGQTLWALYEAWLLHGGGGYHIVLTAPAADEASVWPEWEATLASARAEVASQAHPGSTSPPAMPGPPLIRYRCPVGTQLPVTLGNVTTQNPATVVIAGSPSLAAWSLLGVAAARLYGGMKAKQLEGQTVSVPATGEAVLMDDRLLLRLVVAPQAGGVTLRGGPGDRSVDLEIPYRVIRRSGSDPRGVWLDVVGRDAIWLQPQDRGEFGQWLARLTDGKTWRAPERVTMRAEVPVVGWLQQDPRFTLGLPAGWVPAPPPALADYGRFFLPSVLRAGALLDAGVHEAQVLVIENGPASAVTPKSDEDSLAAIFASAANITPNGPITITTAGGEPLALLRGFSWAEGRLEDRCYGALARAGVSYAIWYTIAGGNAGDGSYEAWLPHFHTMLATWHWYV